MAQRLHELSLMAEVSVDWFFAPSAPHAPAGLCQPQIAPAVAREAASLMTYAKAMPAAKRRVFIAALVEAAEGNGVGEERDQIQ